MPFRASLKTKPEDEQPIRPAEEARVVEAERIVLEEEQVYRRGVVSIRDLIAPAAMKVDPSFLRLGDTYVRTIFVVSYPRYIAVGWSAPILNLNRTMDIAMFFYPIKPEVILKQLRKKV